MTLRVPVRAVSPLGAAVTGLTAAAVGWWLLASGYTGWALALGLLAVAAWVVAGAAGALGHRAVAGTSASVAVLVGALAGPATSGNTLLPAVLALLVLLGDEAVPILVAAGVAVAAVGLVGVGALLVPTNSIAVVTMIGAIGLGALGGYNRRQSRRNQRQAAELAERALAARDQEARAAVARDLHDVLAHTLGGLVIQLDAAEALLEAGRVEAAAVRVTDARALAGAGLGEARRAVAALRRPAEAHDATADVDRLPTVVANLVADHRRLGGTVTLIENGADRPLTGPRAAALESAVREALSNARRHAPGQPVTVELAWAPAEVRLVVTNPLPARPTDTPGGGYGLRGMTERFAGLPGGGRLDAGVCDGRFVVRATAPTAPVDATVTR